MKLTYKVVLIISITVISIIGITFIIIGNHFDEQVEGHLLTTARAVYDNIVIVRKWVSDREGVFVLKKEGEESNPFLPHPDLLTTTNDTLVMRNPALVTRELSELSLSYGKEFSYHLSSLRYINPKNSPDEFEYEALQYFEKNLQNETNKEFYHYQEIDSVQYFRYFAPLYTSESCLSCHKDHGYKLGDLRGGISILLPAQKHKIAKRNHFIFFSITGLLTVVFLSFPMFFAIKKNLITPLREIEDSAGKIREGDYNHPLKLRQKDEIGSLAEAFEEMRIKIKAYTDRLKDSEKKYRSLIDHSIEAVAITDEAGRIVECNRNLSKLTRFEDGELKQKHLSDFLDMKNAIPFRAKSAPETESEHFETVLRSKDQLSIPVEIYTIKGISLGLDNHSTFVYIRDLTERKKIEKYSLQTEKMFALGHMSSGIAHEIRNPLFALNNNMDYLNQKFGEEPDFQTVYPEFTDAVNRIENIVSAILDYSRPHELLFKPIKIEDVITQALLLVKKQFEKSAIQIVTRFNPEPMVIQADPHKLEQVFINLFINAFQAMSHAGILTIVTEPDRERLMVTIRDTGKGIPPDELPRVFDPFFTKTPDGTGLGMSIVQRILEQHNAAYSIDSEVGLGTTFKMIFNAKQEA